MYKNKKTPNTTNGIENRKTRKKGQVWCDRLYLRPREQSSNMGESLGQSATYCCLFGVEKSFTLYRFYKSSPLALLPMRKLPQLRCSQFKNFLGAATHSTSTKSIMVGDLSASGERVYHSLLDGIYFNKTIRAS